MIKDEFLFCICSTLICSTSIVQIELINFGALVFCLKNHIITVIYCCIFLLNLQMPFSVPLSSKILQNRLFLLWQSVPLVANKYKVHDLTWSKIQGRLCDASLFLLAINAGPLFGIRLKVLAQLGHHNLLCFLSRNVFLMFSYHERYVYLSWLPYKL